MRIWILLCLLCSGIVGESNWKNGGKMSEKDSVKLNDFMYTDEDLKTFHEKSAERDQGNNRRRSNFKLDDFSNFMGEAEEVVSTCFNETEFLQKRVMPHAVRWVKMFLRYSKLGDMDLSQITNPRDKIYASLNFNINVENLRALQGIRNSNNPEITMSQLDQYLSDIMFNPVLRDVDDFLTWFGRKLAQVKVMTESATENWQIPADTLLTLIISKVANSIIVLVGLYRYFWKGIPFKHIFIQSLVALTAVEVAHTYVEELKKEEWKNYMKMKEYAAQREECDPKKQGLFGKMWNWMTLDPCSIRRAEMNIEAAPHVSLAQCILKSTIGNLVEAPFIMAVDLCMRMADKVGGGGWFGSFIYPAVFGFMILFMTTVGLLITGLKFKLAIWPFTQMEFYFPETGTRNVAREMAAIENPVQNGNNVVVPTINITNLIAPRKRNSSARLRLAPAPRPAVSRQSSAPTFRAILPSVATEDDIDNAMMRESDDEEVQEVSQTQASSSSQVAAKDTGGVRNGKQFAGNSRQSETNVEKSVKVVSEIGVKTTSDSQNDLEEITEGALGGIADTAHTDQVQMENNVAPDDGPCMAAALRLEQSSFLSEWFILLVLLSYFTVPYGTCYFLAFQIAEFYLLDTGFLGSVLISSLVVYKRLMLGLPVEIPYRFQDNF